MTPSKDVAPGIALCARGEAGPSFFSTTYFANRSRE